MEKTDLKGVPETMLQTLYARAMASKREKPLLYDEKAIEIVDRMDYDFSAAGRDRAMSTGVIARTILLDRMTADFLLENPDALIINIACGLDTRCSRMEGRYSKWYNLDLPETIGVRKKFLTENGPSVFQIALSATDEDWPAAIGRKDGPVLIIIEGLTMYLSEDEVRKIFSIIGRNYPGATVFVETMNPWVVKHVREKSIEGSQAGFSWGIRNGRKLEELIPSWRCESERSLTEGMAVFMPVYRLLGKIGFIRNISNRILVMRKN